MRELSQDSRKMLEYLKTVSLPISVRDAGTTIFTGCCKDVKAARAKIAVDDLVARKLVRVNERKEVYEIIHT